MKTRIVAIADSLYIRLPKGLLRNHGLAAGQVVEVCISGRPSARAPRPREGWEAAFANPSRSRRASPWERIPLEEVWDD